MQPGIPWWRLPVLVGITVLGAGIFCTALPVAVAGLIKTSGDPVLRQLQKEHAVGTPALRSFIRSREAAADWRGAGQTHMDIALGRLMLNEQGDAAQRREHLVITETALSTGLGRTPMNPYGWMRLVQVRMMRNAPASDIVLPLKLALRTGPHEDRRHAMLLLILEAGLCVWDDLGDPERQLIADKARYAWRRDAFGTATVAERAGKVGLLALLLGF